MFLKRKLGAILLLEKKMMKRRNKIQTEKKTEQEQTALAGGLRGVCLCEKWSSLISSQTLLELSAVEPFLLQDSPLR